jgi:hypothetical protein
MKEILDASRANDAQELIEDEMKNSMSEKDERV